MNVPQLPDVVQWAVPGFVALVLLEMWLVKRRDPTRYEPNDTRTSLLLGFGRKENAVDAAIDLEAAKERSAENKRASKGTPATA